MKKERNLVWFLFLLPTLSGVILFMVYPIIESLRLSFFRSNGTIESFVGFRNYIRIFQDENFWRSMFNTFYMGGFKLLIAIPLGFVVAYMINNLTKMKNFFKIVYFIPYVTSMVAAALVFKLILHSGDGLLNHALSSLGLPTFRWLMEPTSARWGVILLSVWHWIGFVIIVCIANLQLIPKELYEAAEIDGASEKQHFMRITIPQMSSCFAFLIITGSISALKIFSETFILGGAEGSPGKALLTMVGYVYGRGIGGSEFGYGSAAAYVLFLVIMLFTLINMRVSKMKL